MATNPELSPDDPLGLNRVEQEIRIEKLRQEIQEIAGDEMLMGKSEECTPELEESFLAHVLAVETHGYVCPFEVLTRDGFSLPPPDELDDATLSAKLQELAADLGRRRLFLENTDHLSDRELYSWLWWDALRQGMMGFGLPYGNCHLDVLGGCSEEDIITHMRYYANEEYRAEWAAEFPDFPMPPPEKPPFDRDRYLPKPEY